MQAAPREPEGRVCGECKAPNTSDARYCKACGGSLVAPAECPACKVAVSRDSRFCSGCGAKLVGARPNRSPAVAATPIAAPPPTSTPKRDEDTRIDAKRELERAAADMPRPKPKGSNIVGNVLLFVAALSIFVVVMYTVNKDAPKEVSPFMGGPAPSMGGAQPQQAAPQQPQEQAQPAQAPSAGAAPQAANAGGPIKGTIMIDAELQNVIPPKATVFVIARNQGMPNMGPPVAVKKIDNPSFPLAFELSASDAMQPGTFIGPFDIYVRVDADGNAMTKAPGDFAMNNPKSGVTPGMTGLEIIVDKRL